MGVSIDTCGNTTDGCSICDSPAYMYVFYNGRGNYITCNGISCIITSILRLFIYKDEKESFTKKVIPTEEETAIYVVPDVCPTCGHKKDTSGFLDD